jgi:hypothetical protein
MQTYDLTMIGANDEIEVYTAVLKGIEPLLSKTEIIDKLCR